MKRFMLPLGMVAVMVVLAGCGPVPAGQYAARRILREGKNGIRLDAFAAEPPTRDLSSYRRLEVEPLQNQMEDRIPAELVAGLNQQLLQQLQRVKGLEVARVPAPEQAEFPDLEEVLRQAQADASAPSAKANAGPAEPGGRQQPALASPSANTLILRGAIVDYDGGKQSMRVLQVGVGRQAVLTVHLWLVDGGSGQVLAKYVVNSEVYRLPSDSHAAVVKLSQGVGELVAELIEKKSAAPVAASLQPSGSETQENRR